MSSATEAAPILARVRAFIDGASEEGLDHLARDAFVYQARASAPIARLAAAHGVRPRAITSWREIPPVPAGAFAEVTLGSGQGTGAAEEIFRSSGTSGGARSIHRHPFPDLYRQVINRSFPTYCLDRSLLAGGDRVPMLALVPPRSQVTDSSLGFMVDHLMHRWSSEESCYAFGTRGTETTQATAFAQARERDGRPALVLTTAFALVQWLDALAERNLVVSLPAGSVVFETGGTKGRVREIHREDLLEAIENRLGVSRQRVVREYGMTELTSQLYGQALTGGDPDLLSGPPWVRAQAFDVQGLDVQGLDVQGLDVQGLDAGSFQPSSFRPAPDGEPGLIAIFDLANLGSALHVLTEDVGVAEPAGIRLLGRASGAQLRGCSLTVEELIEGKADPSL